jgi:hypothetical protein
VALQLVITSDEACETYSLQEGVNTIGSDTECTIPVAHPEVPAVALTVEVKGGAAMARNRSPFTIYLGQDGWEPKELLPWAPGDVCSLTRSVTIELQTVGDALDGAPAVKPTESSPQRKVTQLAAIALCLAIGAQQLMSEDAVDASEETASFGDLVKYSQEEIDRGNEFDNPQAAQDWAETLRLLQEARYYEVRIGKRQKPLVRQAYQRLIDSEALKVNREGTTDPLADTGPDDSTGAKVRRYATIKKDAYE